MKPQRWGATANTSQVRASTRSWMWSVIIRSTPTAFAAMMQLLDCSRTWTPSCAACRRFQSINWCALLSDCYPTAILAIFFPPNVCMKSVEIAVLWRHGVPEDLVFLGLVCQSEHVYLLRTKPNYEKKVRPESVGQEPMPWKSSMPRGGITVDSNRQMVCFLFKHDHSW